MATIKSYTDIKQSLKLAEILPLESADMYYPTEGALPKFGVALSLSILNILCWSLAALLSVLEHPRCFQGDKPTYWFCGCFGKDKLYYEVEADNPVDACYEMILKLNELKML